MTISNQPGNRSFVTRPKSLEKPGKLHDLIWGHWPPDGYRQQVDRVVHRKDQRQSTQAKNPHTN